MIKNTSLKGIHKTAIEFFLKNIETLYDKLGIGCDELLNQINNSSISIENTLYYCIIKFYHNGHSFYMHDKNIEIQVINANKPPVVFHMYFYDNKLYEFEYFNADSSIICEQELFKGDVLVQIY